jgi:hypothetical protein
VFCALIASFSDLKVLASLPFESASSPCAFMISS